MGKRVDGEQFGLFQSERDILDLHDAGTDPRSIAKKLGKNVRYVDAIIERFDGGGGDAWIARARQGSASLLRAILRYRPASGRSLTAPNTGGRHG